MNKAPKKPGRKKAALDRVDSFNVIQDYFETCYGTRMKNNTISKQIEIAGKTYTEKDYHTDFVNIRKEPLYGKKVSHLDYDTYMKSAYIPEYNPIDSFFSQATKEVGHIAKLSSALIMAPGQRMTETTRDLLVKKWLVGMVAGWHPADHNPLMLILTGPKNCGKTEFFRRLFPIELRRYFAESVLSAGKDDEAKACENLLILVDEMDFLLKKEAAQIRRFLSAVIFTYRAPYGKKNEKFKRCATFCGTSNEREVITDRENNRRIIPINIQRVDHEIYNSVDKKLLFYEAYNLFKGGFNWQLTGEDISQLEVDTEENEVVSPEADLIQKYFIPGGDQDESMTAPEILGYLGMGSKINLSVHRLGKALRDAGFTQKSVRITGYGPRKRWIVKRLNPGADFE
jgi:predicted P-loop ATPase